MVYQVYGVDYFKHLSYTLHPSYPELASFVLGLFDLTISRYHLTPLNPILPFYSRLIFHCILLLVLSLDISCSLLP